jgi:hypothetical protein
MNGIRAPLHFSPDEPLRFDGSGVGTDTTSGDFNAAVLVVIAAIERGYHPTRDATPMSSSDWATLACALLAAIGRGYYHQHSCNQESTLEKVRAKTIHPNPLTPEYPTLFHRLAALASQLETHIRTDQEDY